MTTPTKGIATSRGIWIAVELTPLIEVTAKNVLVRADTIERFATRAAGLDGRPPPSCDGPGDCVLPSISALCQLPTGYFSGSESVDRAEVRLDLTVELVFIG